MKKFLSHLFVILANFYLLSYLFGIFLMLLTVFLNGLNPIIGILSIAFALVISIGYQIFRHRFEFYSFGELLIQNDDKSNILNQNKNVTITRIPLFIAMLLTLLFSGNILDGISEGQIYTIGMVVIFSVLTYCTYYGMTGFVKTLKISSVLQLIAGLMLTGFVYLISKKLGSIGDLMFYIYLIFSIIWIVLGFIYESKKITTNA